MCRALHSCSSALPDIDKCCRGVDEKVRVKKAKPPPAVLPAPLRGLPAMLPMMPAILPPSADISPLVLPCPTSSLKYGNAEPSEFHSTTALAAWVAKWAGVQMGVDNIFTIHTGVGVDTGQQVNLSIQRPFLEKIDSSAPSRSREEGKVVAEAATALGEPPSNILDLEQAHAIYISTHIYQ